MHKSPFRHVLRFYAVGGAYNLFSKGQLRARHTSGGPGEVEVYSPLDLNMNIHYRQHCVQRKVPVSYSEGNFEVFPARATRCTDSGEISPKSVKQ